MFVSSQSMYESIVFSLISFLVAVPSAIKIFNWTTTMYKGNIVLHSPMLYAISFLGIFTVGGLTGLFLGSIGTDVHLTATYFVVAHFHYVMVGGTMLGFLGALHYWWPKMTGRLFPDGIAKVNAIIVFCGFNLTFFLSSSSGGWECRDDTTSTTSLPSSRRTTSCRRSALRSSTWLYLPAYYLTMSLINGKKAGPNPWGAHGLEWETSSPPPTSNFLETPIVMDEVYDFDPVSGAPARYGGSR